LGEITKAEVERRNTEREEEEKEAKTKKKEAEDTVKALEGTLNQKRLDKEIAEKELASLQTTYTVAERTGEIKEKIRQTQVLIQRLDGEIKITEAKLQTAKMSLAVWPQASTIPVQEMRRKPGDRFCSRLSRHMFLTQN
jgi:chromosome segregation ATPase